jgi:4-amino-4-deoxy-L-arabinose transferase-like glycosyltransferase
MFDMLIVFFTLVGVLGIIRSWLHSGINGWLILGVSIGLGILAKGPVILIHTLPLALLAPWWATEHRPAHWLSWYAGLALAVAIGILIALAWAIPAAIMGGEQYSQAIFWGQSAGRMVNSFAHNRPFWWYLPLLPVILFPWLLWPALWRAFRSLAKQAPSSAVRLCLAWMVPVFILFSLISGKQPHYLLPLFPAFALLSSYALNRIGEYREWDPILPGLFVVSIGCAMVLHSLFPLSSNLMNVLSKINPYYGLILIALSPVLCGLYRISGELRTTLMSVLGVLIVVTLHLSLTGVFSCYDMRNPSSYVARLQSQNTAISYVGKYHGVFNFLGRLKKPLDVIREDQVRQWAVEHPDGRIIADEEHLSKEPKILPEYQYTYGTHILRIWKSSAIIAGQR